MNSIDDVRCGIEMLDSFSRALAEAQHNFCEMDDSDYSAAQRETLGQLYQDNGDVFVLLGTWSDGISDWRNLPSEYFIPEPSVLSYIANCENTILRGSLRWAVVEAHKPSSAVNSPLQIHSADDAAEYMVPKPEGDMQVVLIRITDLPKLVDLWGQRVVSGLGEEEMVEVCRSNKPNVRKSVTKGLFVLAWKIPGKYEDMWMDAQGFATPDVPELI
ncbi:hypothetical protein FOVG_04021 [Fusarium oxysporum f. sp. pisi HDV247]|uniref:Uncharacterized protein n=1 Tax=Fusarium oxysporum f. sp. pisi HDV247 TaxID=1080344 RepID=W9PNJ2_FUSOX|nr:hypothetical protein FOVG_04021 [Fusarium oxysporum f. sp. pisi HDV247]